MPTPKQQTKFQNSQGKALTIPGGDHGISVARVTPTLEVRSIPEALETTVYEVQNVRDPTRVVAGRHHAESEARVEIHRESIVEFVCFGKSHLYPAELYPIVAPYWRDRLLADAYIRDDGLRYDQQIAEDMLRNKSVIGILVRIGAAAGDLIKGHNDVPSPDEYQKLRARVETARQALASSTASDYEVLHENGVELARIASDHRHLNNRVHGRVEQLVKVAEHEEKAAAHVEEASFWVLDIYGQVVCRDPLRLFAYRFAVLTVRAGAHAAGTGISGGHAREVFREAGKVVIQQLPAASTGLILGMMKKRSIGPSDDSILRTAAEQAISIVIFVFFFAVDYYMFEADQVPADQRTDVFVERLAPELAKQIVTAVAAIVTHKIVGDLPAGSPQRKQVERLGAVIPALITSIIGEIARMQAKAKGEHRPFHDVFSAEAGWSLVTVVQAVGQAWVQDSLKSRMELKHAQDTDGLTIWIKSVFKEHTERPEPPKPQPVHEDGEQASKKKNGAAALEPRPEKPAEPLAETPPKPDKKTIRAVPKTPAKQRPVTSQSDLEKLVSQLGPAYTSEQVDQAVQAGKIKLPKGSARRGTFVVPIKVRDDKGNVVAEWFEVGKGRKGRPNGEVHAQKLALARVSTGQVEVGGKKINVKLQEGWTVEFEEPYRGSKYNAKSSSAVGAAKPNSKGLLDIKDRFRYTTTVDSEGKTVMEVRGELGVPGTVVQHRSESSQKSVSGGKGDDAGHLIGNQFGASGGRENLSLQNWIQNEGGGTFHDLEGQWKAQLLSGTGINATVQDITRPGEDRPFMRRVAWTETDPSGRATEHQLIFANPHTAKSRDKQGIPATSVPEGNMGKLIPLHRQ